MGENWRESGRLGINVNRGRLDERYGDLKSVPLPEITTPTPPDNKSPIVFIDGLSTIDFSFSKPLPPDHLYQ